MPGVRHNIEPSTDSLCVLYKEEDPMPAYAVLGAQWGDEGKGKIIDFLARDADIVARFSGGNNAGHTVINDLGDFSLHIIT